MANYVFSVSGMKYGTPTGTSGMPGGLTSLPDTVKGSITVEETEGSVLRFYVDQKKEPIRSIKAEEGEFTLTAQFYDMGFASLAAFKGGSGNASGFVPSTDYTTVDKALEVTFSSGHVLNIFNGSCTARLTGGGGRDKMLSWELKVVPMITNDGSGSYDLKLAGT